MNVGLALIFGPMLKLLSTHSPSWIEVLGGILILDLVAYMFHRLFHRFDFLFRFHGVHHSDPHIEVTTALRFHFGEVLIANSARLAVVWALGFSYQTLIAFELTFLFFNMFEHANLRLPQRISHLWSRVFITPALHRRHHSIVREEMNSNYGTIFSIWDRALGTLTPSEESDQFPMGLRPDQKELGPFEALFWPFKRH